MRDARHGHKFSTSLARVAQTCSCVALNALWTSASFRREPDARFWRWECGYARPTLRQVAAVTVLSTKTYASLRPMNHMAWSSERDRGAVEVVSIRVGQCGRREFDHPMSDEDLTCHAAKGVDVAPRR